MNFSNKIGLPWLKMLKAPPFHLGWIVCMVAAFSIQGSCSKKSSGGGGTTPPPGPQPTLTFTNPLMQGSDPWVVQRDTNYYYTHTLGNRVGLWKTSKMSKLADVPITTVFSPTLGAPNSQNIWAPELHLLDGKWYIYYTAGAGPDSTQRLWVLENSSTDPTTGTWTDRGRIFAPNTDFWAIDATILEHGGNRYLVWSGRPITGVQNQNLYIAKMSNPWTIEGNAVLIGAPDRPWERNGGPVNEGPQVLINPQGRVLIVYSASGCWTDDYALGVLMLKEGGDPLNPADWTEHPQPVFAKSPGSNAYGPGHNAFFTSRDGSENWIIYHANSTSGAGCGVNRNIRMQKFGWTSTGLPDFGQPVATGQAIAKPAGE